MGEVTTGFSETTSWRVAGLTTAGGKNKIPLVLSPFDVSPFLKTMLYIEKQRKQLIFLEGICEIWISQAKRKYLYLRNEIWGM